MTPNTDQPDRRRRLALSVRTRFVAVITVVAAFGLVAVGLSVFLVERQRILDQVDLRLHTSMESARWIVSNGDTDTGEWASSSDALRAVVERMTPDDNTGAMGMVDGSVAFVPGVPLDLDLQDAGDFAGHVNALLTGGEPIIGTYAEDEVVWRYLAAPVIVEDSPAPTEVVFVMVYDVAAELDEIHMAGQMFLIASVITLIVIAAAGTIVATRLLRPLRRMRETAERVSAHSLDERIPVVGNDDVAELAETMNDMLDRLDDALEAQRRLLSDVGHELKTPITIVRGYIEVMDPDSPDDARETQALATDELDRMGRLVQDLAGAAALHGPSPVQRRPVDIADLLEQITRKAQGLVGAEVSLVSAADGVAFLDSNRITQAMLQLAQNAVTHGGGHVEIGSQTRGSTIEFWVRDHGPGVDDVAKQRVFDRFYRVADPATPGGSGLGLSIVQMIARAHGGTASVHDADGGGAEFRLRIPRGENTPPVVIPDDLVIPPRPPLPTTPTGTPQGSTDPAHVETRV